MGEEVVERERKFSGPDFVATWPDSCDTRLM